MTLYYLLTVTFACGIDQITVEIGKQFRMAIGLLIYLRHLQVINLVNRHLNKYCIVFMSVS